MFKKLRRRFVLIAMISMVCVLSLVVAAINIINYYQIKQKEDQLLEMILDNGGTFPELFSNKSSRRRPDGSESAEPSEDFAKERPYEHFEPDKDKKFINEETKYQTRFFTATFSASGRLTGIDTGQIASVDSEEAAELAEQALAEGSECGKIDHYRYASRESGGKTIYVFLDVRSDNATKQNYLLVSLLILLASTVLVFILLWLLSKRVIRPFVEMHEKQKQFITDASHEIKTPLAIISANTEVIEMTSEPTEWTESIKNQIKRLDGLVKDLVRLSKTDEARSDIQFAPFDLSAATEEAASAFEAPARTHGEDFELDIEQGIELNGSEELIRQVIGIFADNAVKYCDEGGLITVSLKKTHKHIRLSVINDCAEPPTGDLSRLFDRFYRSDEARQRRGSGGYGIGLSIAKATAEAHKAKAECKAENGRISFGLVFRC
ncbi:MAG: HAMP domain-containing histidine kinase [Ruminococcus sp.]|nr:HAMP domain-containing histidine kinase [Ruminococcus sp.]